MGEFQRVSRGYERVDEKFLEVSRGVSRPYSKKSLVTLVNSIVRNDCWNNEKGTAFKLQ